MVNRLVNRVCVTAFVVAATLSTSVAAGAQVEQSDIGSQQGGLESSQLITSNAEVRRAVIGLLAIAGIAFVVFVLYWALTGRAAKARFAREFGGRHAVDARPRRGRRRRAAVAVTDEAVTAVAPGAVEPPRRRVQAQAMPARPAPAEEPRIHAGWVDPSGRRRVPVKVHPAWVDQSAPAPARATVARHAAPAHDPERPWREPGEGPWPRPFDGR